MAGYDNEDSDDHQEHLGDDMVDENRDCACPKQILGIRPVPHTAFCSKFVLWAVVIKQMFEIFTLVLAQMRKLWRTGYVSSC